MSMQFAAPDSEPQAAVTTYNLKQHQLLEQLFLQATVDHGNMRGRHSIYAASYLGMLNTYIGLAMNGSIHPGGRCNLPGCSPIYARDFLVTVEKPFLFSMMYT